MLVGVVALSLLVGGIVIMNIMLMAVSERTREIGLRKALGAKRRDILTQILTESVVLSVFGGVMGRPSFKMNLGLRYHLFTSTTTRPRISPLRIFGASVIRSPSPASLTVLSSLSSGRSLPRRRQASSRGAFGSITESMP